MRGAFNHNWDPYWYSALYGAYAQLKYGDAGAALICGALAGFGPTAGITSCNPDFNVAQIGVITHWTPGEEFDVLGGRHLYPSRPEACWNDCSRVPIAKPAAVYELKDQDTVTLLLRAQRNF